MARNNSNHWKTDPEYSGFLNYIIERTRNVESPICVQRMAREFKEKSGAAQTVKLLRERIYKLRSYICSFDHIDTKTKVKLMFALSAPVNARFLEELEKDAFVEIDDKQRIIDYNANDGSLELSGEHSLTARLETAHHESKRSRWSMSYFENMDDVVSSTVNEVTAHIESRWWSMSHLENKKDVVPKTGDEEELGSIDFITKSPPTFEFPESSERKADFWVPSSSKRTLSSPDYNSFHSYDDPPKFELNPFRRSIQEDLNEFKEDEIIQQIPKPQQAHDEHTKLEEVPIKIEIEEPVEVKPETSHNSRIKFFEAMQSLIFCLDTPSLYWIQSKIEQKIQKIRGLDEVILNNEIVQIVDSLISQMSNTTVVILSGNAETVNLSNFLCYLKAAILNSKMSGVEGLVQTISKLIEESQNKRVPMEKVANALRTTLDIDDF